MARRYTDLEVKPVVELRPGDEVLFRHTIEQVTTTATSVTVTWDDGTESTWQLDGDPALEVVAQKGA